MTAPVLLTDDIFNDTQINNIITVDRPSTIEEGDLIIFLAHIRSRTTVVAPPISPVGGESPDEFTEIILVGHTNSNAVQIFAYYKIATADEPATYSMEIDDSLRYRALCFGIRGVDPDTPIDNVVSDFNVSNGNSLTIPGFTPENDNTLAIGYLGLNQVPGSGGFSEPTGTTEVDSSTNSVVSYQLVQQVLGTGALSDRSWSWTDNRRACAIMFNVTPILSEKDIASNVLFTFGGV